MLTIPVVIIIFLIAFIVFYWQFRMRSKEIAFVEAKKICDQHNFQLLDDSIAFIRIGLIKNSGVRMLTKTFEFDYADTLGARKKGQLIFHKHVLLVIKLDNLTVDKNHSDSDSDKIIQFPGNFK